MHTSEEFETKEMCALKSESISSLVAKSFKMTACRQVLAHPCPTVEDCDSDGLV
jgi:hypothetical protein